VDKMIFMKIQLKRKNDAVLMEATNENGNSILMDGSPTVGGVDGGFRPMQTVLAALGGCSAIDVVDILKKQRQPLEDLEVEINAEREDKPAPSVFTAIDVHFKFKGDLNEAKVQKAVELSIDKYCSVARMLEKSAIITFQITIN
jgi:putative redox protein